ncbi:MAG: diguanylate cyclase [Candidatus Dormibacteria bacterium]
MAALALAGVALGLATSQARAEQQLNQTFQTRADIARQFVASYVNDIFLREQDVAGQQLGEDSINDAHFRAVVQSFGFTAAVVLDDHGRALDIFPAAPGKIGANLAARYAHLARAEQGFPTVSHVIPSASLGRPVVAFAAPYSTAHGRRVFSGAFDVNATPVANYLHNSLPQAGARAYLVDKTSGVVVADEAGATPNAAPLSDQAPQLAAAVSNGRDGSFRDSAGARYFVQRDVLNAPWRVVMSVPDVALYGALDGPTRWAPWGMFALLVAAAVLLGRMLERLQNSRRDLVVLNGDLVLLARIDKLTGLYNRRHMEDQIDVLLHTAARAASPASLLMLDVDHFKSINDRHGHAMGDGALRVLADAIRVALRPSDICGRWGGEEFVVLLPNTDVATAVTIGDRLRQSAAETPFASEDSGPLPLTISVGVAGSVANDLPQTLVARADAALYRAKAAGRNVVAA